MTILNPRIENGEFKGILFDKYDYKWLSKEELPNAETQKLNNSAYALQNTPLLTNYYVIIPEKYVLKLIREASGNRGNLYAFQELIDIVDGE